MAASSDEEDISKFLGFNNKDYQKEVAGRVKDLESGFESQLPRDKPVVARLDGVSFHTWTKGLHQPYDHRFILAMQETCMDLLDKFGAVSAYTMSDEITLLFPIPTEEQTPLYNYRVLKLSTVLAGYASARFNHHISDILRRIAVPELDAATLERMHGGWASFDCRVFSAPDLSAAAEAVLWRHRFDCPKNGIATVARHAFGDRVLKGVGCYEMLQMLKERGTPFENEHPGYKYGTLVKKAQIMKSVNEELSVLRNVVVACSVWLPEDEGRVVSLLFAKHASMDELPWKSRSVK